MNEDAWVKVGDVELMALTIGGVAFLVLYTLLAKWWRWREGWFIAVAGLGLTCLFGYISAVRIGWLPPVNSGGAATWIRLVIFTGFGVTLVWIGVLLLMAQFEKRGKLKRARRKDK